MMKIINVDLGLKLRYKLDHDLNNMFFNLNPMLRFEMNGDLGNKINWQLDSNLSFNMNGLILNLMKNDDR